VKAPDEASHGPSLHYLQRLHTLSTRNHVQSQRSAGSVKGVNLLRARSHGRAVGTDVHPRSLDPWPRSSQRAAANAPEGIVEGVGSLKVEDAGSWRKSTRTAQQSPLQEESRAFVVGDAAVLILVAIVTGLALPWVALYLALVLVTLVTREAYRPRLSLRAMEQAPMLATSAAVPLLVIGLPALLWGGFAAPLMATAALTALALPFGRGLTYGLVRRRRCVARQRDRAIIVGSGQVADELAQVLVQRPEHGVTPVGFVDAQPDDPRRLRDLPLPTLGRVSQLQHLLAKHDIHRLIVAYGVTREAEMVDLMRTATAAKVDVHVVPRFFDVGFALRGSSVDEVWGIPLYRVRRAAMHRKAWALKRVNDFLISAIGAVLAFPLLVLGALLAKHASGGGPVLFRQTRIGQHGQAFELLKFRSLPVAHSGDTTWSVDARGNLPWSARLLRRTSIDELPQLWNVLRGDMSLVGPRPERPNFVSDFGGTVPGYRDRHRLPVGLTGWAQVNGLRGDTSIAERARFDNVYVERWSPWFDMTIVLRTFGAVLREVLPERAADEPSLSAVAVDRSEEQEVRSRRAS
jgi:exopolysaccharide biosynthesis polyprenyl glycosylphosphotransferase